MDNVELKLTDNPRSQIVGIPILDLSCIQAQVHLCCDYVLADCCRSVPARRDRSVSARRDAVGGVAYL